MKLTSLEIVIILIQLLAILCVFIDNKIENKYLNRILPWMPIPSYMVISALTRRFAPPFNIISFLLIFVQLVVSICKESKKKDKQ